MMDMDDLGTILGVWAHPDDEAYLSAGLMARARQAGSRVVVVTATRGEQGAFDPVEWPPHRLGPHRSRELDESLRVLGVSEHHLLGHPDGGCSDLPVGVGALEVARVVAEVEPDTVLTFGPDGYTGHPDHRTVSGWVDAALILAGSRARVLHATADLAYLEAFDEIHRRFDVFFAGEPSVTDPADMAVHIELSGDMLDRKVAALVAQHSQTGMLIDSLGMATFRRWVAVESFVEHASRPAALSFR
jgi:LmbE family N-acetylglucosaminyl deacetylase